MYSISNHYWWYAFDSLVAPRAMRDLFWKTYNFKYKGVPVHRRDRKALVIILGCLSVGSFVYLGVPIITWHFLAPVMFWQKLVTLVGIGVYECFMVPLGIMVSGGIVAIFAD